MSGAKRTPAPWSVYGYGEDMRIIGSPDWPCKLNGVSGKWQVATIDDFMGEHDEEQQANAHLIAAAPELLEALINAVDLLAQHYPRPTRNGEIAKARAAIAKAEGGS